MANLNEKKYDNSELIPLYSISVNGQCFIYISTALDRGFPIAFLRFHNTNMNTKAAPFDFKFKLNICDLMALGQALVQNGNIQYFLNYTNIIYGNRDASPNDKYERKPGNYKYTLLGDSIGSISIDYQRIVNEKSLANRNLLKPFELVLSGSKKDEGAAMFPFDHPTKASALGEMILELAKKTLNYSFDIRVNNSQTFNSQKSTNQNQTHVNRKSQPAEFDMNKYDNNETYAPQMRNQPQAHVEQTVIKDIFNDNQDSF